MAHRVFRRSLTAGIAFAGAGAIAVSTLPVLPSDQAIAAPSAAISQVSPVAVPRVLTTEVEYASLVRSLEVLVNGAVGALGQSVAAFTTQIPALIDYVGIGVPGGPWEDPDLLPWNHSLLLGATLFSPIAPLVVGSFTDAVVEVLAQSFPSRENEIRENLTETVDYLFARVVGPIISALGATGAVHQAYYRAGMEGNPPGQWLALLSAPIHIIDGFLNGGYGDLSPLLTGEIGGDRIAAPGLLTPWGKYPVDRTVSDVFDDVPGAPDTLRASLPAEDETDPVEGAETVATPVVPAASDETTEVTEDAEAGADAEPTGETGAAAPDDESDASETDTEKTKKSPGSESSDRLEGEKAETAESAVESEKAEKAESADESEKADKPDKADGAAESGQDA